MARAAAFAALLGLANAQEPPRIGPNGDGTLLRSDDRQWLLLQDASITADLARGEYEAQFGPSQLGLNIVASFVRAHRGSLTLGDAPGGGALVTLRLPSPWADETLMEGRTISR